MTDAKDVVRVLYAGLAAGDVPGALAALSADVVWTEAAGFPYAGTYHGQQAVLEHVFARLGTEWDGFKAVPDTIVGDGDVAAAIGWYSGTYKATGKAFKARYVHWFTVTDGRISRFEQVTDTIPVAAALS
ncbi:nuclear transport factor 2 family protein [Dactylosporangium sp. CA-092794]|uniref:nuclear transport factor 2 family protein n=1 Tax=Dactylosporangium sp. CA-092794 TaxID=3239929 RepID=UPI003D933289